MNEQYRKLHALELNIAKEIKRICEKHDIKYFLTAGSLLGAIRHGGFIPWDDDMDIGMLREEYEHFVNLCDSELGEEYMLQTWDTDPEYPFSYGKIRLKGTHIVETFSENTSSMNGIFVDIFPFDNAPDSPRERKRQAQWYFICKRLLWIKKGFGKSIRKESAKQALKYDLFFILAQLIPYESLKKFYKNRQQKYNRKKTTCVVTDGAYGYTKEILKREWVDNLESVKFENEKFLSYRDSVEYLRYFYGDYMELPPEEKRTGHSVLNIDFGKYEHEW